MHKKKVSHTKPVLIAVTAFAGFVLVLERLLRNVDIALLNPQGPIAEEQLRLSIVSVAIMLEIAIPTLIIFYFFAWKYRESNEKAVHEPNARHGKLFVFGLWAIPSFTVLLLASIMWPATQRLEPQKAIDSNIEPLTIQVVAMRWKWLFIYPEQNIATVNFVQVPINTPLRFELSADEAPMSSFWIPHLGGQLYAMTGHVNPLNLMAEKPGEYPGSSAEINGPGFAGMKFVTRASSKQNFDRWVQEVKSSSNVLSATEYQNLLMPSENNPVILYAKADPGLYDTMLDKYLGSHDHQPAEYEAAH